MQKRMIEKNLQAYFGKGNLLLLIITFAACHDKEALRRTLVAEMVQEGIENHQKSRIANCEKEALEEAKAIVDSLLIQAALTNIDTTYRILRPIKPARPAINLPTDTTPIKPLFQDSTLVGKDSSSR